MTFLQCTGRSSRPVRFAVCAIAASFSSLLINLGVAAEVAEHPSITALHESSGFSGITLIYDDEADQWISGSADAGQSVTAETSALPASTFKIFSTMTALQAGVAEGPDTLLRWDGTVRSRPETNRDMTLREAFAISAVPHYQQMVQSVGGTRMQAMLDAAEYGNQNMSGGLTTFWLSGELRISPLQQIELLQRLRHNDLPFQSEVMAATRDIMRMEQTADYALYAKTGLTTADDGGYVGWYVGWIEKENDTWYFATLLRSTGEDDTLIPARIDITRRALQSVGALP
ncbi:MAG: penicillin-binding transpeptidase domain-containing protein [Pseudomonadota bacterium]|nr:penicillin-binding transpeptidase domain-containing protein [Pseudomonadota bacterium]